jgi:transcriptional regulator with XRE-family HTH domain
MTSRKHQTFGQWLRDKRVEKKFSLRKFAELVGVSPTYLSQVEQGNIAPPTAERVKKMAQLLGENPDEMIGLADRVPDDLPDIIKRQPGQIPELLREASGLTSEQLKKVRDQIRKIKEKGDG